MDNVIPMTRATKKMQPPPKRAEVIEALTQLKYKQLIDEREAVQAKQIAAEKAFRAAVIEWAKAKPNLLDGAGIGHSMSWPGQGAGNVQQAVAASISIDCRDVKVLRLLQAWKDIKTVHVPDMKRIRSIVRSQMSNSPVQNVTPTSRVNAMLGDNATRKVLEQMLEAMSKPTQIAIAG